MLEPIFCPHTTPVYIIVEDFNSVETTQLREDFNDIQRAYYWAKEQTGVKTPFPSKTSGKHEKWSFVSLNETIRLINENIRRGCVMFRFNKDETYYKRYIVYYNLEKATYD
jgi:hypothetical protein